MKISYILLFVLSLVMLSGAVYAEPNFQVSFMYDSGGWLGGGWCGNDYSSRVRITNVGTAGTMKVEFGVYDPQSVKSWYASMIAPVSNCKALETNTVTKSITLNSGESVDEWFPINLPKDSFVGGVYTAHVQAFVNCWSSGVDVGQTSHDTASVLVACVGGSPTCTDGIMNQGETGTDCGSVCPVKCSKDTGCNTNADCQSGLYCLAGKCASSADPQIPGDPSTKPSCEQVFANDPTGMLSCVYKQNESSMNTVILIFGVIIVVLVIRKLW